MQINTYASDYLYVTRFYRSFLAGTTLKMSFSSCCCRGEVFNGYPKRQTGRLYKWKFKIVAQLYSKVPSILIQKAPLKGRTDVFKLYLLFAKIVIIIVVCLYLKELYRGCYVSASALSHTLVFKFGKKFTLLIHFEPFNSKKETQTLSNLLLISLDLHSIVFLRH